MSRLRKDEDVYMSRRRGEEWWFGHEPWKVDAIEDIVYRTVVALVSMI